MSAGRDRRGARRAAPLGAVLALTGAVGMAVAQGRPGAEARNPSLTLGLSLGVEVDDDRAGLLTGLGLDYVTATREQRLAFSLDADALLDGDGFDRDAFSPRLGLDYAFDNGVSLLTLSADLSRREVDGLVFVLAPEDGEGAPGPDGSDDVLQPGEVGTVEDDGTLETRRLSLGMELFRTDPVGLELGAALRQRDYQGTSDPDLEDAELRTLEGALRLTVAPGLTFRLTASAATESEEGLLESETRTRALGASVAWQATPTVALSLGIQNARREETRNVLAAVDGTPVATGARETVENAGLTFDAALVRARPNGEQSLALGRRLTDERSIYDLSVGRALALPGGGSLQGSVGLSAFEDGDAIGIATLAYRTELRPGAPFQASLSRRALTDDDDEDIARTDLRLSYGVPLTPVSRASLALGVSRVDVVDGFEPDSTGGSVTLGYDRALSPDWSLSARYTVAASRDAGARTERDDRVSLTLGRTFDLSP